MTTKINNNPNVKNNPTTAEQRKAQGVTPQFAENGLFHTPQPQQNISYKAAPNEHVIQNEGSYIVLGTDRPDGTASGYGAMGSNRANSIDLVVGRMSNARGGDGPPDKKMDHQKLIVRRLQMQPEFT